MKLTRYSDYALRISLYLAVRSDRLVTIPEIVEVYDLPKGNVMKLATDLVRVGVLESVRGRSGGLRLARAPEGLSVGEILRHTEGDTRLVDCSNCVLAGACGLVCVLNEAKQAFFKVLDGYTLQDVLDKQPAILDRFLSDAAG